MKVKSEKLKWLSGNPFYTNWTQYENRNTRGLKVRIENISKDKNTYCYPIGKTSLWTGKLPLRHCLGVNKRLNTAYVLKESFGQLWDYQTEGWARRFFDNRKKSLKWQRLKPYEKFTELIEKHWDGIAAHSKPENKIALGFVPRT